MNYLVEKSGSYVFVHGASDDVSELIANYYKWKTHIPYMEIWDASNNYNVLATIGSKKK